jgi:putative ABC transport system permease protein
MDNYISQTLGGIINQLRMSVRFAIGISIGIAILITAMFFKMLMAKDAVQISIMRSIGFSPKDIHTQYVTRALLILILGIVTGTLAAATVGQGLASLIIPGVSSMRFIANPLIAYILCPMSLIAAVMITIWLIGRTSKVSSRLVTAAE